jgi:uncharacterized protein
LPGAGHYPQIEAATAVLDAALQIATSAADRHNGRHASINCGDQVMMNSRGPATARIGVLSALLLLGAPVVAAEGAAGEWHETVRQFAAQHFKNPAWGYSHSARDYQLARRLATEDGVSLDDDVLYAAAYLHDMAAFPPYEKPDIDHADEAARIVDTVLAGTGFPMAKIEAVRGAIRTHMFDRNPVGPEATYLHDADALDWLGAIGVARIFGLVDPSGGEPNGPAAVKMLEDNLAQVPPRVLSRAGRSRVAPWAEELRQFLQRLRDESDNLKTL